MKKIILIGCFILITTYFFAMLPVGSAAPAFSVADGNEIQLHSHQLKGKVVVGFYETRETSDKNNALKNMLNVFYKQAERENPALVFKLAVIDATSANAFTRWIWRKKMRGKSEEIKITVYGDWDGKMKRSFGFPEDESTFLIIDKKGIIRYVYSGLVPQSEYTKIKEIITQCFQQN